MASKSRIAPKVKPSRVFGFATDYPDMTPAGYAPGTNFSAQEFTEFNHDLPDYAKLWPGSYRVDQWSEGDPKKEEVIYTAFKHTSGPFEGQIVPRDITYKKAGEVTGFTSLHDPKHIKPTQGLMSPGSMGQGDFASTVLKRFGEHLKTGEV